MKQKININEGDIIKAKTTGWTKEIKDRKKEKLSFWINMGVYSLIVFAFFGFRYWVSSSILFGIISLISLTVTIFSWVRVDEIRNLPMTDKERYYEGEPHEFEEEGNYIIKGGKMVKQRW